MRISDLALPGVLPLERRAAGPRRAPAFGTDSVQFAAITPTPRRLEFYSKRQAHARAFALKHHRAQVRPATI